MKRVIDRKDKRITAQFLTMFDGEGWCDIKVTFPHGDNVVITFVQYLDDSDATDVLITPFTLDGAINMLRTLYGDNIKVVM